MSKASNCSTLLQQASVLPCFIYFIHILHIPPNRDPKQPASFSSTPFYPYNGMYNWPKATPASFHSRVENKLADLSPTLHHITLALNWKPDVQLPKCVCAMTHTLLEPFCIIFLRKCAIAHTAQSIHLLYCTLLVPVQSISPSQTTQKYAVTRKGDLSLVTFNLSRARIYVEPNLHPTASIINLSVTSSKSDLHQSTVKLIVTG